MSETNIQIPRVFRGARLTLSEIRHLGPVRGLQDFLFRIDLQCLDGDKHSLDYVHMKVVQGGEKEITFANDDQPIPIKIALVLQPNTHQATVSIKYPDQQLNIRQFHDVLRVRRCLGKPVNLKFTHIDTGLPLLELYHDGSGDPPSEVLVDAVAALVDIQVRLKRLITVPIREFSEEEWKTIGRLYAIVRKGKITGRWSALSLSLPLSSTQEVLRVFGNGQTHGAFLEVDEVEELFGTELPLGIARTRAYSTLRYGGDQVD